MSMWTKKELVRVRADGLVCPENGCACILDDIYDCGADDFDGCEPGRLNECETCDPDETPWDGCFGPGELKEDWCMSPFGCVKLFR